VIENLGGTKDLKDQKEMPGKRVVYRAANDLYSSFPSAFALGKANFERVKATHFQIG